MNELRNRSSSTSISQTEWWSIPFYQIICIVKSHFSCIHWVWSVVFRWLQLQWRSIIILVDWYNWVNELINRSSSTSISQTGWLCIQEYQIICNVKSHFSSVYWDWSELFQWSIIILVDWYCWKNELINRSSSSSISQTGWWSIPEYQVI